MPGNERRQDTCIQVKKGEIMRRGIVRVYRYANEIEGKLVVLNECGKKYQVNFEIKNETRKNIEYDRESKENKRRKVRKEMTRVSSVSQAAIRVNTSRNKPTIYEH